MSAPNQASETLPGATIYLAEQDVADLGQLVKDDEDYEDIELDPTLGIEGRLLVGRHPEVAPGWVDTLESITTTPLPAITTQLASAALVVRLAGRWFAFAFGQGRHLLRQDALVDDFGLRVAANTVDPGEVRGVDARRFERGVVLTRRQGSRPGRAEGLGLQVDREMLQAIVGRSRRPGEGRVHGRKSLGMARDVDLRDLDRLGAQMLADYASRDFLDGFPTLERLQAEPKNSALARRLDAELIGALRDPDSQGAYLAPPAILDWERVSGFRFSGEPSTVRREEASLNDYLLLRPDPTLSDLHEDDLRVVDRNSMRALDRWPIYRWLVWEKQQGDDAFALSEGRWYKVNGQYLASINSAAQRIQPPDLTIPVPARVSMPEAEYNADLAMGLGGVLLDRQLAQVGTERGRFELCDVFVPPDKLIHVKRGIGSQELSYLFTQGVTSAEGMRHEGKVRERFRDLVRDRAPQLGEVIDVDAKPAAGAFEVVYVVVDEAHARVPARIPFFARASLSRAVRALDELDYRYSAVGVPDGP
jgi:uncharacterized protein (TIGR04141 family)